jgi:hypothetical protein
MQKLWPVKFWSNMVKGQKVKEGVTCGTTGRVTRGTSVHVCTTELEK